MKFDILVDCILKESNIIKLRSKSQNPKVIEYKDIVYSWGKLNPINDREVLIDNCLLILQVSFNGIYIEHIRSLPQFKNKGYASKLLRRLTDLADKMIIRLTLHPQLTDSQGQGLPKDDLINWYKRYGFEYPDEDSDYEMIRYPR
jgi:GNAT superfamily N-acetyltransferase